MSAEKSLTGAALVYNLRPPVLRFLGVRIDELSAQKAASRKYELDNGQMLSAAAYKMADGQVLCQAARENIRSEANPGTAEARLYQTEGEAQAVYSFLRSQAGASAEVISRGPLAALPASAKKTAYDDISYFLLMLPLIGPPQNS